MKKNGEYVGVDENFIPENEKYVDESMLGDKEESKRKIKKVAKGFGIGYLVFMFIPVIIGITMMVFMVTRFNNANKIFGGISGKTDTYKTNKYTFFHLQGTQSGWSLRDYLDDIITNNKLEAYTRITVVYNGKSFTTEEELLVLKNKLPNTSTDAYEVSVDYADSRGQAINKVTIKDIESISKSEIEFKPAKYMIQFDSKLLGEEFNQVGNEILECDYEISFLENNKFTINMNFGNTVSGTYSVTDDDKIICNITEAYGEYSPEQEINAKITLKINSDSEIEITEAPESYTIRIGETTAEGWKLSEETKEMSFWPLVKGIKYSIIK